MKLVAKCLVSNLPHSCPYCRVNEELKKDYTRHLLIPICLKEYGYDTQELYFQAGELFGGNGADLLAGKALFLLENGMDMTIPVIEGLEKIKKLMDSMDVYEIILPKISSLCGTKYIYDGTFGGGFFEGKGILPSYLEKI